MVKILKDGWIIKIHPEAWAEAEEDTLFIKGNIISLDEQKKELVIGGNNEYQNNWVIVGVGLEYCPSPEGEGKLRMINRAIRVVEIDRFKNEKVHLYKVSLSLVTVDRWQAYHQWDKAPIEIDFNSVKVIACFAWDR